MQHTIIWQADVVVVCLPAWVCVCVCVETSYWNRFMTLTINTVRQGSAFISLARLRVAYAPRSQTKEIAAKLLLLLRCICIAIVRVIGLETLDSSRCRRGCNLCNNLLQQVGQP